MTREEAEKRNFQRSMGASFVLHVMVLAFLAGDWTPPWLVPDDPILIDLSLPAGVGGGKNPGPKKGKNDKPFSKPPVDKIGDAAPTAPPQPVVAERLPDPDPEPEKVPEPAAETTATEVLETAKEAVKTPPVAVARVPFDALAGNETRLNEGAVGTKRTPAGTNLEGSGEEGPGGAGGGIGRGYGDKIGDLAGVDVKPKLLNRDDLKKILSRYYPAEKRRQGLQGTVMLKLVVYANGATEPREVVYTSDPGFNDAAEAVARKLRFAPARLGGRPVPVQFAFQFDFRLDD